LKSFGIDTDYHDIRFVEATTGNHRRSAPGASGGRCGSTAWRSPSSPISSRRVV
jgi:hypothetical protein